MKGSVTPITLDYIGTACLPKHKTPNTAMAMAITGFFFFFCGYTLMSWKALFVQHIVK